MNDLGGDQTFIKIKSSAHFLALIRIKSVQKARSNDDQLPRGSYPLLRPGRRHATQRRVAGRSRAVLRGGWPARRAEPRRAISWLLAERGSVLRYDRERLLPEQWQVHLLRFVHTIELVFSLLLQNCVRFPHHEARLLVRKQIPGTAWKVRSHSRLSHGYGGRHELDVHALHVLLISSRRSSYGCDERQEDESLAKTRQSAACSMRCKNFDLISFLFLRFSSLLSR